MGKIYGILFMIMLLCIGCQWQLKPNDVDAKEQRVSIQRYDRIETLYLTTGDYSALQQMNTEYRLSHTDPYVTGGCAAIRKGERS